MKKYQPYQNEEKVGEQKVNRVAQEERPEKEAPAKPFIAWSAANDGKVNAYV